MIGILALPFLNFSRPQVEFQFVALVSVRMFLLKSYHCTAMVQLIVRETHTGLAAPDSLHALPSSRLA
jgi:hypothetical protein